MAQAKLGQRDESRVSLKKVLTLAPTYLKAQVALITLEVEAGRHNDAMLVAQQIHAQNPRSVIGLVLQGDIYMAQKQFTPAAEAYDHAWSLEPSGPLVVKLHQALSRSESVKNADTRLIQWIEANPKDVDAHLYQAGLSEARGERVQAINQYQVVLEIAPGHLTALNNLAMLYQKENDPRARSTAEQAYRLNPDNPALTDTLGWIMLQQGEIKAGAELIQKAALLATQNPEIRYHLAVALAKTGDTARARKELRALLDSDLVSPLSEEARRLLESL